MYCTCAKQATLNDDTLWSSTRGVTRSKMHKLKKLFKVFSYWFGHWPRVGDCFDSLKCYSTVGKDLSHWPFGRILWWEEKISDILLSEYFLRDGKHTGHYFVLCPDGGCYIRVTCRGMTMRRTTIVGSRLKISLPVTEFDNLWINFELHSGT